jgi:hypothetical protein
VSDSEYKARLQQYGVMVMLRDHSMATTPIDTASFYFVDLIDSTRTLEDLGFIRGSALVDSGARFAAVGASQTAPRLLVTSTQAVASRLHESDDACTLELPTPLRLEGANTPWVIALSADGAQSMGPNIPDSTTAIQDSDGMKEALRIANSLVDSARPKFEADTVVARPPLKLARYFRFNADGAEIMVADARRMVQHRITANGKRELISLLDQRPFIAERNATTPAAPFVVKWHFFGGGSEEETNIEVPTVVLRLGKLRMLTLYTSGQYEDGNGGTFISRSPSGEWREVARWVGGC